VAATASNSNSEPPKTSIGSPGPSTSTSKEDTHNLSPEFFDLFLKQDPEKVRLLTRRRKQLPF